MNNEKKKTPLTLALTLVSIGIISVCVVKNLNITFNFPGMTNPPTETPTQTEVAQTEVTPTETPQTSVDATLPPASNPPTEAPNLTIEKTGSKGSIPKSEINNYYHNMTNNISSDGDNSTNAQSKQDNTRDSDSAQDNNAEPSDSEKKKRQLT